MTNRNILLVDDDQRNIFALTAVLRSRNFSVVSAQDFPAAMEILRSGEDIHLVLLDMMMPGVDGYEGLKIIRALPEFINLPVIAVTAQAMQGDREKCLEAGATDYISKPVDITNLERLMQKYMS